MGWWDSDISTKGSRPQDLTLFYFSVAAALKSLEKVFHMKLIMLQPRSTVMK